MLNGRKGRFGFGSLAIEIMMDADIIQQQIQSLRYDLADSRWTENNLKVVAD